MNNGNNNFQSDEHKNNYQRINKNARFDEGQPVYIPPSKQYKYNPTFDDTRKDALEEFNSSKKTYIAAVVVGTLVIILGIILTWVAAYYNLKDFYIIGPGSLAIGCLMAIIGSILLIRGIYRTKHANLRVNNGNVVPTKKNRPDSGYSFVTASEVSVHGLQSRVTSPNAEELYNHNGAKISPESTVIGNIEDPLHGYNGNNNNLYNSSEAAASPTAKIVKHKKHKHNRNAVSDISDDEHVSKQVYHISLPNDGNEFSTVNSSFIPDPAIYVEPGVNDDAKQVTFF